MWLLFDVLLDRVRDVVINLATVAQVLLDFGCVTHFFVFAVLVFAILLIFTNNVAVGIYSLLLVPSRQLAFSFLQKHFGSNLFQILVGLLENLHQARVSLRVDHIYVGIKVVLLQRIHSLYLFLVPLLLLVLLLLAQVVLGKVGCPLNLRHPLFVVLEELLLAVQHLFEEFFATSPSAQLLSTPHLLLEAVERLGLFLVYSENALTLVKLAVNQLVFKQVVPVALAHQLGVGLHVCTHVQLDLLP